MALREAPLNDSKPDYAALFRNDHDAFVKALHQEIGNAIMVSGKAQRIAAMLRAADTPLKDLGITCKSAPTAGPLFDADGDPWKKLEESLATAPAEDAVVIFRALAQSIQGTERNRCWNMIYMAMKSPQWRDQVIQEYPAIFRNGLPPQSTVHPPLKAEQQGYGNALTLFAKDARRRGGGTEAVKTTLEALKAIGVPHLRNQLDLRTVIHMAAVEHHVDDFKAFLEAFPECVNLTDDEGNTPLHRLAYVAHDDDNPAPKVRLLFEAGTDMHARNKYGHSALEIAAEGDTDTASFEAVAALLDTGAYDDFEITMACDRAVRTEFANRIRGYVSAMRAQQAIDGHLESGNPSPL